MPRQPDGLCSLQAFAEGLIEANTDWWTSWQFNFALWADKLIKQRREGGSGIRWTDEQTIASFIYSGEKWFCSMNPGWSVWVNWVWDSFTFTAGLTWKVGPFFDYLFCRDTFGADLTYCLILGLPFGVFVFNCMTWSFPAVIIVVAATLAQYSFSSTVAARRWICGDSLSHVSDMHCLMIFLCTVKDARLIKWPSWARKQSWASPCMQMWRGTFPPDKLGVIKEKHSAWGGEHSESSACGKPTPGFIRLTWGE